MKAYAYNFVVLFIAAISLMACAAPHAGHDHSSQMNGTTIEPERIGITQVLEKLERGDKVVYSDSRNSVDWGMAETKIPGAIRVGNDDQLASLVKTLPKDSYVVPYCT